MAQSTSLKTEKMNLSTIFDQKLGNIKKFKYLQSISAILIGLICVHPLLAQPATSCTPTENQGKLSEQGKICVQKIIFDGMSLAQLKNRLENTQADNNCFYQNQYREMNYSQSDSDHHNIKIALKRVYQYQQNGNIRKSACQENLRKAHADSTHPNDCNSNNLIPFVDTIVQTRINNGRIAILEIGQNITAEQIQATKNNITRCYIDNKYINSGAMIPDQEVIGDGIIVMRIIEGWLADVQIENETNLHLSADYVKRRLKLKRDKQGHLNMNDLQGRLQMMQQNPIFQQITGKIAPGEEPGEGILKVTVIEEDNPFYLGYRFNNYRHPSLGSYRGTLELGYRNLIGWGDTLSAHYGINEGSSYDASDWGFTDAFSDYSVNYSVPFPQYLTNYDTTLSLRWNKSDSDVVTEPFDELGVKSDSETWSVSLRQPFYQSYPPPDPAPKIFKQFAVALTLENRQNTTYLENQPFSFSRGAVDGETEYAAIRISPEYVGRSQYNVFAFYNTFSFGTSLLGTTLNEKFIDDGFSSWLGQFQWFGGLRQWGLFKQSPRLHDSRLLGRINLQLADQQLLSLEKFAIGGHATVRGYRESQLIRDNGINASLEWHLPIGHFPISGFSQPGEGDLYLIPFFDYGIGWNSGTDWNKGTPKDISSAGLGLRWSPLKNIQAQIYWAQALRNIDTPDNQEKDLQDNGLHFEINIGWRF